MWQKIFKIFDENKLFKCMNFVWTQVWDALSGDEIHSFQHNHIVKSVDFCESEPNLLATGSNEKLIRIYDLNKPEAGISAGQGCRCTF